MNREERKAQNIKENQPLVGTGYTSLNELREGEHTTLVIPGKGAFLIYKIQGKYFNTRLYEGAPL